ncbi:AIPR family protein [uncultured Methanolobus sp.]|uniref:AIPR family protein n=1 Tax=uncultured Methanolobus sp. TaxID=218300 RepID=UPI0029C6527F|nr:AIPR family protein [uncultured Methanolobus sp.]
MLENKELQNFYIDQQEEIKSILVAEEEGATPEQIFTEMVLSLLADAGETENYRISYDEKINKRGIEHKVNAYSLYENYETLDLFITIYFDNDEIQSVAKKDIEKATGRLSKFFSNAIYNDYIDKIEESSQIFDLAHTLAKVNDVKEMLTRVNIFVLTNGQVKSDIKSSEIIDQYNIYYKVADIDYLFNISEKERIPIEIDFANNGFYLPCIENNTGNDDYQSYLAIVPGDALIDIYEQYGPRLLEQNVRSFLQFTGKYNKGIRNTILNEPHMFLAFNNGIAATADEIELYDLPNSKGKAIAYVKDFQIVNGGQTTASIYHTWKQNKSLDTSQIFVQLKLTIVKNKENFGLIIGKIAEYANTQNKVSASDLSANRENHIVLEKLSRTIWAPPSKDKIQQTRWFFERAKGQYKNARLREGYTPARRKAFDLKNPRSQLLTKENIAKYINTWQEVYKNNKLVIAPHIVVRGSQKNYSQFLSYNYKKLPDNIFFEDTVSKAILFKTSENVYGVKPNSIGDMRYITVPYSIGWLGHKTDYKIDLYKIWKKQELSSELKHVLYDIMVNVEQFIKDNAPGSLYGEWAKKEECWNSVKRQNFDVNLDSLSNDLVNEKTPERRNISQKEIDDTLIRSEIELIQSIPVKKWNEINKMGHFIDELTPVLKNRVINIMSTLKMNKSLTEKQRKDAINIIDIIVHKAPDFFDEDEVENKEISDTKTTEKENSHIKITPELVRKMVEWNTKAGVLSHKELLYISEFIYGSKQLNSFHRHNISRHLQTLIKAGFEIK